MTMRLRQWAMQKGYDGFVYQNHREGDAEDAYVTFTKQQVTLHHALVFDAERFLKDHAAGFAQRAKAEFDQSHKEKRTLITGLYWQDTPVEPYWSPEAPQNNPAAPRPAKPLSRP